MPLDELDYSKIAPVVRHVWEVLADQDPASFRWQMSYQAFPIIHPGESAGVIAVHHDNRGLEGGGSGKSIFQDDFYVDKVVGRRHGLTSQGTGCITSRFNSELMEKTVLLLEEAHSTNEESYKVTNDCIKYVTTCVVQRFELKGIDKKVEQPNGCNIWLSTNDESFPENRRLAIFEVSMRYRGNQQYFTDFLRSSKDPAVADHYITLLHHLPQICREGMFPADDPVFANLGFVEDLAANVPRNNAKLRNSLHSMDAVLEWIVHELYEVEGNKAITHAWMAVQNAYDIFCAFRKTIGQTDRSLKWFSMILHNYCRDSDTGFRRTMRAREVNLSLASVPAVVQRAREALVMQPAGSSKSPAAG